MAQRLDKVVGAQARLQDGLIFWGTPVLSDAEQTDGGPAPAEVERVPRIAPAVQLARQARTFPTTSPPIGARTAGLDAVHNVDELAELIQQVAQPPAT